MSVRRAALLVLLLASPAAALGSAAPPARSASPTLLPPSQATALATATASVPSGSSTQSVDGGAVLAAATLPGAQTSVESGLSPQVAVGLVPPSQGNVLWAARPTCWANYMWHEWGTWPYQQRVTDTTYWCAVYNNHITYRTSTTTASGTLCGVNWRAGALIAGGVGRGFTFFTNRSTAGFACPTIVPWITIHTTHHEDVKRNDRGVTTLVASG